MPVITSLSFPFDETVALSATAFDVHNNPAKNGDTSFAWNVSGADLHFGGGVQTATGSTATVHADKSGASGTIACTGQQSQKVATIPVTATGGAADHLVISRT